MSKEKVSTPYDDAFRTLIVKCPMLAIPLVNEAFHEKYELRENVQIFHNEFFVGNRYQRKRITDSHIGIGDKRYHAECQSSMDGTIAVRIFEYDAQIAVENVHTAMDETTFTFPYSTLLYKRFAKVLQQKVKEGRLTEYERQAIRDMTVKVVSSLAVKWDNIRKGVEKIMGGEILELEVDKILNRGIDIGKAEGLREGLDKKTDTIVRNMLLRGMTDADIMAIAECDRDCVDRVRLTI